MSEISTESTAPATTESIAEAAFDSLESADGGGEIDGPASESAESAPSESAAAPETLEKSAAAPTETPGVVLSAEASFLAEQGHKLRRPDGKPTYLPAVTVEKMLARYVAQHSAKWAEERTQLESSSKELQGKFSQIEPILSLLDQGPEKFLEEAGRHDPRYREFLTTRSAPPAPAAPVGEMPSPDLALADGSRTYSLEGLKKLLEWNTAQVESRLLPKVDERLKPLTERERQLAERDQLTQAETQVRKRAQDTIADAQTWPGFKEHEPDILAALRADSEAAQKAGRRPTLSLDAAYRQVVLPKLTEDDNARRARLLKEVSAANKAAPTVQRTGGEVPKSGGRTTTQDIAARALAKLEGTA